MSGDLSPFDIIRVPVITEKAGDAKDELNKVTFLIDPRVSKATVRKAVENAFGVKVVKVNVMNYKGKKKKFGRLEGRRPDRKKAVVTLSEGDNIEVFDQV